MKMRRTVYAGPADEGRALLERAPVVHIATTGEDGRPLLRAVHPVLDGDLLAFHGAPAGEKMEGIGRPAVVAAHEVVAEIPSWFLDPERACPATTYYVSAQIEGALELVDDPVVKARVLQALMTKYQPEGRHVPVTAGDPLYAKAVRGLLVAGVRISHLACKAKLGQNRNDVDRAKVIAQLWERGGHRDVAAVDFLVRRFPALAPASFRASGLTFACALSPDEIDAALELLADAYWLTSIPVPQRRAAIANSSATVLARDDNGEVVGFARAVSDGRTAWIYDVIVRRGERRSGVGSALFTFLLDHPAVRRARVVRLGTKDAMPFYRRFGFIDIDEARAQKPYRSTDMIRGPA